MAGNKKPSKPHRNTRVIVNPVQHAIMRAAKLTDAEREKMIGPVKTCFDRLRMGKANAADFKHITDALNVAQALTMPGIGLLPDHGEKFDQAQYAFRSIAARWNSGKSLIATGDELRAIETGIEFHEIQLQFASAGELVKATQIVDRALKGAQSGSPAPNHISLTLRAA